jgi:hypothetical protein
MDGGLIPVIHTQLFITLNVDQWSTCWSLILTLVIDHMYM